MITNIKIPVNLDIDYPDVPDILTEVELFRLLWLEKPDIVNTFIKDIKSIYRKHKQDGSLLDDDNFYDS